ncbi:MAG: GGDEF domain-containing protein, partial [Eubacteriales bacterium]
MYKKQTKKNVDSRISMKTSMRGILLLLVILQSGIIFLAQSENNTFVILLSVSILLGLLASATLGFLAIRKITVLTSDMEKNMLEAQYQLDYDALTQLNSRTAFYRKTYELIAESPQTKGAMLFIDLDNLKYVNDTFGHEYGDLYLITASQIFSDIAQEIGVASRMSGDEFAVFIHGFETDEAARDYVKNKLDVHKLVSINLPDGTTQRVRFSSGLSYYPSDSCNIKELVKYADFAMYEAKHTVKGSMREFNRDIYAEKIYLM